MHRYVTCWPSGSPLCTDTRWIGDRQNLFSSREAMRLDVFSHQIWEPDPSRELCGCSEPSDDGPTQVCQVVAESENNFFEMGNSLQSAGVEKYESDDSQRRASWLRRKRTASQGVPIVLAVIATLPCSGPLFLRREILPSHCTIKQEPPSHKTRLEFLCAEHSPRAGAGLSLVSSTFGLVPTQCSRIKGFEGWPSSAINTKPTSSYSLLPTARPRRPSQLSRFSNGSHPRYGTSFSTS